MGYSINKRNIYNFLMQNRLAYVLQQKLLTQKKLRQTLQNNNGKVQDKTTKDKANSLTIGYIVIQKLPNLIKNLMQECFKDLVSLTIINCDLRTFQNFPYLRSLKNLDASKNSLRGSFEFLIKNKSLQCIDVSCNIISEVKRFEPLRYLRNVYVYAKDNPFEKKMAQFKDPKVNPLLQQLKSYHIRFLSRPPNKNKMEPQPILVESDKMKLQPIQVKKEENQPGNSQKGPTSNQKQPLARMLSPKPKINVPLDIQPKRQPSQIAQPIQQKRQQIQKKLRFSDSLVSFDLEHLQQFLNFQAQQSINQDAQQEQNLQMPENEIQLDNSEDVIGLSSVQRPLRLHSRLINQLFSNMQARRGTLQDQQEDDSDSDNDNEEIIDQDEDQRQEDDQLQEVDCSDDLEDDSGPII